MNEPDSQDPQAPPKHSLGKPQGALDEARDLIETMVDDAKRRVQIDSNAARSRGPVTRFLLTLTIIAVVLAAATLAYGIYMFPDAPIRAIDGGYKGKGGTIRTVEDFEQFAVWKTVMLGIVPSVFVLGFAFAVADAKRRRRKA